MNDVSTKKGMHPLLAKLLLLTLFVSSLKALSEITEMDDNLNVDPAVKADTVLRPYVYDQTLRSQDSTYAYYMAEAVYAYLQDERSRQSIARPVYHHNSSNIDAEREKSFCLDYHMGAGSDFINGKTGGTVFDVAHLCDQARKNGKSQIFLRDPRDITTARSDRKSALVIQLSDLQELKDYADQCAKNENMEPIPFKIVMCNVKNAKMIPDQMNGPHMISLALPSVRDFAKEVTLEIVSHEYRHAGIRANRLKSPATDLHGHEKNIGESVKVRIAEEADCDAAAVIGKKFDAFTLSGSAYFNIYHILSNVSEAQDANKVVKRKKTDVVKEYAEQILNYHVGDIKNLSSHPPRLYRFVNVAKEAKIDITQIDDAINISHLKHTLKN